MADPEPLDTGAVAPAQQPLIDPAQALKASKALVAHIKKAEREKAASAPKRNVLDDETTSVDATPILLTLTTKHNISDTHRLQPIRVAVPHPPTADSEATICVVTVDPQRAYKNIVASPDFPEALRKRITRVIDFTHLKAKFRTFDAQRKLYSEHDVFLGDERIINRLPKTLGKNFYKSTAKRPIPVVFAKRQRKADGKPAKKAKKTEGAEDDTNARSPAEIAAEIQKAVDAALVSLTPSTNTSVRVGSAGMKASRLSANISAVVEALRAKKIIKQGNLKAVYLKGPETIALPVWHTDELWLESKDVLPDGSAEAMALQENKKEKANVGRKRKAVSEGEADETKQPDVRPAKKAKKAKKLRESNDNELDEEPTGRQAKPKKQKKAAKQLSEDNDNELDDETADREAKPKKQKKAAKALPESNDNKLDQEIADRKARLKKQKHAAKKALEG